MTKQVKFALYIDLYRAYVVLLEIRYTQDVCRRGTQQAKPPPPRG